MIPLAGGLAKILEKSCKATTQASQISEIYYHSSLIFLGIENNKNIPKEESELKFRNVINNLINKNIRIASIMIETPIMEASTGIMIAGFIFILVN